MLQRIQSIWLFLAALCAISMFKLPMYYVIDLTQQTNKPTLIGLDAKSTIPSIILTAAVVIIAFIGIFMFKNRPFQIKLCLLGLLLQIITIILLVNRNNADNGAISLWSIIYAAIPVFYFLAIKGIRKDERIVKESSRLR